jgi:site-specific recombinase XerD
MREAKTPLTAITPMYIGARHDLSAKSERSYTDQFVQFDGWCLVTKGHPATLADLEPVTVEAFIGHRMKHGIRAGTKGSEHQAAKAAIALKSLATFLATRRVWHDELGRSVLASVLIPQSDAERARLSDEDFARVLTAAEQSEYAQRDRAILFLFAGNGPREKELVGLQLQHYDRAEAVITLKASGTKGRRGYRKPRKLYLDEIVQAELDRYIDEHRMGLTHPEAALFTTRAMTPFTENGLYQVLHRLKVASGVDALCPHALRHYWAEHYEGDLLELKREGGWNSWKLVERYRKENRPKHRRSTLASALAITAKRRSRKQISALRVVSGGRRESAV